MTEEQITGGVARSIFPQAVWENPQTAWVQCPGQELHTGDNGSKDCRLTINDGMAPTLHCVHNSCRSEIEAVNKKMRSMIGKMKVSAGNIIRSSGALVQVKPQVAAKPEAPKTKRSLPYSGLPVAQEAGTRQHLDLCFSPGELVGIVYGKGENGKPLDRGQTVSPLDAVKDWYNGTYIRVNPMRVGGGGDADVTAWRHALIECDTAPEDVQFSAIKASNLPVTVVVSSGGRSVHAWVKVDAATAEEYRQRAKAAADAMEEFEGITVDRSTLNPSRLARLAGCRRGDRMQDLLAVNLGAACWDDWVASRNAEEPTQEAPKCFSKPDSVISFFYRKAKKDYIMVRGTTIVPLSESGLKLALKQESFVTDKEALDAEVYRIITECAIDYDGSMPGYPIGLHVEGGRKYYCDAAATWLEGTNYDAEDRFCDPKRDWPTIHKLTRQLFLSPAEQDDVANQKTAWHHWIWALKMSRDSLKVALRDLKDGERRQVRPGQAMVLCGPKNCGKSFLVNHVIRPILGGRLQDAHKAFSSGSEAFNGELLNGEVWTVDDKEHSSRIDQRRQFGASIKSMLYSGRVGFHAKHKEQVTLQPWARLFILCNDQDEAIKVLPPLTPDIEDKLHLFRCYFSPVETKTEDAWSAYEQQIYSELPAFAGYLDSIAIPKDCQDQRNGSIGWLDRHIVNLLSIQSPEYQAAQLLVHCLGQNLIVQGLDLTSMSVLESIRADDNMRSVSKNLFHDDQALLGRYIGRIMADADRYERLMGLQIELTGKPRGSNTYRFRLKAVEMRGELA